MAVLFHTFVLFILGGLPYLTERSFGRTFQMLIMALHFTNYVTIDRCRWNDLSNLLGNIGNFSSCWFKLQVLTNDYQDKNPLLIWKTKVVTNKDNHLELEQSNMLKRHYANISATLNKTILQTKIIIFFTAEKHYGIFFSLNMTCLYMPVCLVFSISVTYQQSDNLLTVFFYTGLNPL